MDKPKTWLQCLNDGYIIEKAVILSVALVLPVLSYDCWFQNLPVSGYAVLLITLSIIGVTTWGTCYSIKWLLNCNKPLKFYIHEKSNFMELSHVLNFINKTENSFFERIFQSKFDSFNYPTTLNEQVRLFLKDTERDFVKPWYSEISQNHSFLFDTHLLLEEILFKIIEKLKVVNYKRLLLHVLMIYLSHLQEYKKSMKKTAKVKNFDMNSEIVESDCDDNLEPKQRKTELVDVYRYSHPGSQSDEITNYYLKKVTKWILQEYAPQEFVVSLQCKILTGILAKKVLKTCLITIEDPIWIYIKLINLIDPMMYNELMKNGSYSVKEKVFEDAEEIKEFHLNKPVVITKRYMKSNLFSDGTNLFQRTDFSSECKMKGSVKEVPVKKGKSVDKELLNLALNCNNNFPDRQGSHISSVLSGIISSTAGPLLPENVSVCYEPLNKMWQSPVTEKRKDITDQIAIPIGKTVVEGIKIENRHLKTKRLSRSKSTDSMAPSGEANETLRVKDISIGEELCENIRFPSTEDVRPVEADGDCKSKPKSIGAIKKLTKTRSFDSGSIAMDSLSMDSAEVQNNSALVADEPCKEAGDVSPVYEESEDFATTIAKLRSLLQQRESSSTLSDKSAHSIDLPSKNNSFVEDSSNRTQSTDLEDSSFESQVAPDIPTDGRPFINVCIPKMELVTDSNGSTYALYSVQYDGIYKLKEQNNSEESDLVLQTTVVKRRFQEFVNLQSRLEECSHLKPFMKGIKGPSKWLNFSFSAKADESTSSNRKQILETFLQQLCSKGEICAAPELHEFLAYGCSANKSFLEKDAQSSMRRIDKLLTNKVTDVFNTIKTALPSFDFDSTVSISMSENSKGSQDQKLLPGFLNFGNKPEEFELNFNYVYKEPTGESLTDDIRRYFNKKTDTVENAMDVLDSNDWLAERRECRPISSEGKCVWHDYKDILDEDIDQLDTLLPVYSLFLDIVCELLDESDSWLIKEPVIRLVKVLTGHWEAEIEERLAKLDWDQIVGNAIRLLRTIIFQSAQSSAESVELCEEETRTVLKDVILKLIPSGVTYFVKMNEISSAVTLFLESLQYFRTNRDVLLRLLDVFLVQLFSCRHLIRDAT